MNVPRRREIPVISGLTARALLESRPGRLAVSLDLGLSRSEVIVEADVVNLEAGWSVAKAELAEAFSAPEDCVALERSGPRKIYSYSEGTRKYYKLYQPFPDKAPTIIINNATMHCIVGMDPWQDEEGKVKMLAPRRGGVCLDTCCGLGYSAQLLAAGGCRRVVSCELDRNVLEVAAVNPWSRGLFDDERIEILLCDVREFAAGCEARTFSAIFHDPPTIYQAGDLYAEELYREFARILTRSGVCYHYVGAPGGKRGQDYARGVMRRLRAVGFGWVQRKPRGVLARLTGAGDGATDSSLRAARSRPE